jgi:hypothetical protein
MPNAEHAEERNQSWGDSSKVGNMFLSHSKLASIRKPAFDMRQAHLRRMKFIWAQILFGTMEEAYGLLKI